MRTMYELLKKTGHMPYEEAGLFASDQDAAAATPARDLARWAAGYGGEGWVTEAAGASWLIFEKEIAETDADRVELALKLALECGQVEEDHHKAWVIDQIVQILAGDRYAQVIATYRAGEDGPETYSWDEGVAP